MAEKILVVDDERPLLEILRFNLEREGFQVVTAEDGEEAVRKAAQEQPQLVILDIMLPRMDGLAVCRELRRESAVPILMLTAKDDEVDKVVGLELGADDYVTKPFSVRELVARVKAVLRRVHAAEGAPTRMRCGELILDLDTYEASKGERRLELTPREFELLRHLMSNPGQVFSRETLLEQVWGYSYSGDLRTVDVTVRRLREKVEDDPASPRYVRTRRGVGYYLGRN